MFSKVTLLLMIISVITFQECKSLYNSVPGLCAQWVKDVVCG